MRSTITENRVTSIFKKDELTESVMDIISGNINEKVNITNSLKKNNAPFSSLTPDEKSTLKKLDKQNKVQYRHAGKWWTPESEISWGADVIYRVI